MIPKMRRGKEQLIELFICLQVDQKKFELMKTNSNFFIPRDKIGK
jgi:hypothetical protein